MIKIEAYYSGHAVWRYQAKPNITSVGDLSNFCFYKPVLCVKIMLRQSMFPWSFPAHLEDPEVPGWMCGAACG